MEEQRWIPTISYLSALLIKDTEVAQTYYNVVEQFELLLLIIKKGAVNKEVFQISVRIKYPRDSHFLLFCFVEGTWLQ